MKLVEFEKLRLNDTVRVKGNTKNRGRLAVVKNH